MSKIARGANFSAADCDILVDVVLKFKHIIENKRTDAVSVTDKERAWQSIEADFNSVALTKRTRQQLKTAYENLKRRSKKASADDKVECVKTGGGTFTPQVGSIEEKVLAVLGNRATPLLNLFNSDAAYNSEPASWNLNSSVSYTKSDGPVSNVAESHVVQLLEHNDWFSPASWLPLTSGSGSDISGQSATVSVMPIPAASTSELGMSSQSSAIFALPLPAISQAVSASGPGNSIQSAESGTSALPISVGDSRKWAGRRRPKVQRSNSSSTHMEAVGKFQQLADDKRAYYQQKLEMRQLEHDQKMKILKMKEQLLAKQLQQHEQ